MDLGIAIKNIRKQKKLTQGEFASLCKISSTYLSQIENNLKEPTLFTLRTISDKLEIPLPILFFLALTDEDIQPSKKKAYEIMGPAIKSMVNEFFSI